MATAVRCMLLCLVFLFSPHLSFSYHSRYTHDGKQYVIRSNDDPKQPPSLPCSAINAGRSARDGQPLMHRSHPCSGIGKAHQKSSAEDVLHRDALRLASLFGEEEGSDANIACAPTPSSSSGGGGASLPTKGDPLRSRPGALEYHVTAGFGTPAQKFSVGFDTATNGATLLQCKPCAAYPEPCPNSFDPSASSSLAHVPCGSPDCPFSTCSGPTCTVKGTFQGNATFVTDKLTLSPSSTVDKFRFACLEGGLKATDSSSGILDLSRNRHSLASRAPSSFFTVAFTYCLPLFKNTVGFLSVGAVRPEFSGHNVSYTPLRNNPVNGNLYFVQLAGIGVGGPTLPIPPITLAGNSLLELHTTFTYLKPEVYTALRDSFRGWMKNYRAAPPRQELDTCYDFTGLNIIVMPVITLEFAGGASVDLLIEQMMYFPDGNPFSVGCLAFAPTPAHVSAVAVIGTMAQTSTQVVYDLKAGKVGFVPYRC